MPRRRAGEVRDGWEAVAVEHGEFGRWEAQPRLSVLADGLPRGMGQVDRAYGNAVVPQCAEVIGWMIRELQGD
jgi:hypothetical protein